MIPEAKKDAVACALWEALGVTEFADIRELTAGLTSALVFRIVVRGSRYLLRIIMDTEGGGYGHGDLPRQIACMRAGAEAGIAPRVLYASTEDGISITDFVDARPFPRVEALARLPLTLKTLHALPPFPGPGAANYFDGVDRYVRKFHAAGILPESESAEIFGLYTQIAKVYPRDDPDRVSSHNDLKPQNILFDGTRVWLVDWEAAFLNDRYSDLAVVANFVVTNDEEEEAFLYAYFGEAPGRYRLARFFLMRQIAHLFYTAVMMLLGSAGRAIDAKAKPPEFRDLHNRIWAGEFSLATAHARFEYGTVHMRRLLENSREARFQEALEIVAAGG